MLLSLALVFSVVLATNYMQGTYTNFGNHPRNFGNHAGKGFPSSEGNALLSIYDSTRKHLICEYNSTPQKLHLVLLLLLSGQIELNPGPTDTSIYPCGICEKPVNWGERGICCDKCDIWHHASCLNMGDPVYLAFLNNNSLSWICCTCGFPNFSTSFFEVTPFSLENSFSSLDVSELSTPNSDINQQPIATSTPIRKSKTPKKAINKIKVNILNCRSVRSTEKRARLQTLLESTKPDIMLGTESHLDPSYSSTETFGSNYEVLRKDRKEGGGGVFILVNPAFTTTPLPPTIGDK